MLHEIKTYVNYTLWLQSNSKHVNISDGFYLINCNELFIFLQLKHTITPRNIQHWKVVQGEHWGASNKYDTIYLQTSKMQKCMCAAQRVTNRTTSWATKYATFIFTTTSAHVDI